MARYPSWHFPGMAGDGKAGSNACDRGLAFQGIEPGLVDLPHPALTRLHAFRDDLWGETIFFDNASLLQQIGGLIEIPPPAGEMKPATFKLDDPPLVGHGGNFV